jgi:DNA polymerase III delta prime subunit
MLFAFLEEDQILSDNNLRSEYDYFVHRMERRGWVKQPYNMCVDFVIWLLPDPECHGADYEDAKTMDIKILFSWDLLALLEEHPSPRKKASTLEEEKLVIPPTIHIPDSDLMVVDRYSPTNRYEIIGNEQTIKAMDRWFRDWGQHKTTAFLLAGAPGIGKTLMTHLLAKEFGYKIYECNASDQRNKIDVLTLLKDFGRTRVMDREGYSKKVPECCIMDEVDGMTAFGVSALISVIKKGLGPIICICNDKYASCLKALKAHCQLVNVYPPTAQRCFTRIKDIANKEGIALTDAQLREIIADGHGDIRSTLNMLQMVKSGGKSSSNDLFISTFEATKRLFQPRQTLDQRLTLYWQDHDLIPLFVQENYLKTKHSLDKLLKAADSISQGDMVHRLLKEKQDYSLLSTLAVPSVVYPTTLLEGGLNQQLSFPSILGKTSNLRKRKKIHTTIQSKMRVSELSAVYPILFKKGAKAQEIVDYMLHYGLDVDEIQYMIEDAKVKLGPVKSAITKLYNKQVDNR